MHNLFSMNDLAFLDTGQMTAGYNYLHQWSTICVDFLDI